MQKTKPLVPKVWSPGQQRRHHLETAWDSSEMQIPRPQPCTLNQKSWGGTLRGMWVQRRSEKPLAVDMGGTQDMLQWQKPGLNSLVWRRGSADLHAPGRGSPRMHWEVGARKQLDCSS